jgi:hypothetical protein
MTSLRQPGRRSLGEGGALRRVCLVPRTELSFAWPALWPLLERAAGRTAGGSEADVRATIESGHAELWVVLEEGRPLAAVTTQITLEPEKRCRLWLVGGCRMTEWAADFMAVVEPWARAWGCKAIWGAQSRRGWARIVRLMGFEEIDTVDGTPAWGKRI